MACVGIACVFNSVRPGFVQPTFLIGVVKETTSLLLYLSRSVLLRCPLSMELVVTGPTAIATCFGFISSRASTTL